MPPLPTASSASTAEPSARHVGRTCHQGQNPKNHNRKAPVCLQIFFLFCLPFCLPARSFESVLENYGAQSQNQVQNLFFAGCLLVVLLVVYKTASSPNHCNTRLSGRILLVNLLVAGWSFRWSVENMLAFQSITAQYFPLVARWSFRWSLVCCSFVVLFVSHRPVSTSTRYGIRLLERILFVILFVGHSFCHEKYPICVTNFQPRGSYGGQS